MSDGADDASARARAAAACFMRCRLMSIRRCIAAFASASGTFAGGGLTPGVLITTSTLGGGKLGDSELEHDVPLTAHGESTDDSRSNRGIAGRREVDA